MKLKNIRNGNKEEDIRKTENKRKETDRGKLYQTRSE